MIRPELAPKNLRTSAAPLLAAALLAWPGVAGAECLSPEGKAVALGFLACVKNGNNFLGSLDHAAIEKLRGHWDVDCVKKTMATDLIPEDDNNKVLAVTASGSGYQIYLHYIPDNAYYAWVVSFLDTDTVRTQYKGRVQDGKIEEWVINGVNTRTGDPVKPLSRCNRVLWCTVGDGASTAMHNESGTLQPYFSKGDQWPMVLDLGAGTAAIPYKKDNKGRVEAVNEQYALTTTDVLYSLRSTDSAFNLLSTGVFQVETISLEVHRQDGAFDKIQKVLDRNSSQGAYQYFTEGGRCQRTDSSVITPARRKF